MAERDIGTGRILNEVDNYLKRVSSTQWDFKKEDLGLRAKFLFSYFKPVNGENLLEYYNKILKGVSDRRLLESFATSDFLSMSDEDQGIVLDMAIQLINYGDRTNLIQLVNHKINADFVESVESLGSGRVNEEGQKFLHVEDYIQELDADDVVVLIDRLTDIGVMSEEIENLAEGLQLAGPLLIAELRNANVSQELENLAFDMISSVDLLQSLIRIIKKLKYISKKGGGRVITGGYNKPNRSSYMSDIETSVSEEANGLSPAEVEEKLEDVYAYLEDVVTRPVAETFRALVEGNRNYQVVGADIVSILSGKPFDVSNKVAYIKAKVFEGLNNKLEVLGVAVNQDVSVLTTAFYYLSVLAGSDNPVEDVMNVLGTKVRGEIINPKSYELESLLTYTYITNDTNPVLMYASMMKDQRVAKLIQHMYSKDRRGEYLMSIKNIDNFMKEKEPGFKSGRYQLSDINTVLNVFSGGVNKSYKLSQEDVQDLAEVILNAITE